jgi:hypothetical protein
MIRTAQGRFNDKAKGFGHLIDVALYQLYDKIEEYEITREEFFYLVSIAANDLILDDLLNLRSKGDIPR